MVYLSSKKSLFVYPYLYVVSIKDDYYYHDFFLLVFPSILPNRNEEDELERPCATHVFHQTVLHNFRIYMYVASFT